jgi:superfamily II DNA or RNA helicase
MGLMVIDEAHVIAAKVFTEVAQKINTKYTLGLTASYNRDDGLTFLVENTVGRPLIKATVFDSVKLGSSILPDLRLFYLKKNRPYTFKENESYHRMVSEVLNDLYVVNFISYLVKLHYDEGRSQILITQKVEESEQFAKYLIKIGIPEEKIGLMLGKTKEKERKEILEKIKSKEILVVITSKIFDKGVSANNLEILYNVFPSKQMANTIQRIGRVSRVTEGKESAIVYDFIYDHPIFMYQFYNPKKDNYRLKAFLECCNVPGYVEPLLKFIKNQMNGRYMNPKELGILRGNLNQVVINVDEFPLFDK